MSLHHTSYKPILDFKQELLNIDTPITLSSDEWEEEFSHIPPLPFLDCH